MDKMSDYSGIYRKKISDKIDCKLLTLAKIYCFDKFGEYGQKSNDFYKYEYRNDMDNMDKENEEFEKYSKIRDYRLSDTISEFSEVNYRSISTDHNWCGQLSDYS